MGEETVLSLKVQRVIDLCSLFCSRVNSVSLGALDPEAMPGIQAKALNQTK